MSWDNDAPVEVFYAEFLLAQWVLQRSPWNAYHSGLAFRNNRTGEKAMFDFTPEDPSSVINMIMPAVSMTSTFHGALGQYSFDWTDFAITQASPFWPDNYDKFFSLGNLNGSVMKHFARWVEKKYAPAYTSFQPLEVVTADGGVAVRSRLCHDFTTDALWVLHDQGVHLQTKEHIYRDHIIVYAAGVKRIDESGRYRRQWLRYLRALWLWIEEIKAEFTHGRRALISIWKLGMPGYLHTEHADYQVDLLPPFLNYCYLPLAIPPATPNLFVSQKLCALGMEANLTNTTAPWP